MIRLIFSLILMVSTAGAQQVYVTPLATNQEGITQEIGIANPNRVPLEAVLETFDTFGSPLGTLSLTIPPLGREMEDLSQVATGQSPAAVRVTTSEEAACFILQRGVSSAFLSSFALTATPGHQAWVPHIPDAEGHYRTTLDFLHSNFVPGPLFSRPYRTATDRFGRSWQEFYPDSVPFPVNVDMQAYSFSYPAYYPQEDLIGLHWDTIQGNDGQSLASVQHFFLDDGDQRASLTLDRTPSQRLIIPHLSKNRELFWTGLVLINTGDGPLPVTIRSYLDDGTLMQNLTLELNPYEKKNYLIGEKEELGISDSAAWLDIQSFENQLIGYQVFGSPDNHYLAALEAAPDPSSMLCLPHTPSSDDTFSGVALLNPTDDYVYVQVAGLNDAGILVSVLQKRLAPRERLLGTTDALFGAEKARNITWVRIDSHLGNLCGFSLVGDYQRQRLAALNGIRTELARGTLFQANFEHDSIETLYGQGWNQWQNDDHEIVMSRFATERWYEAARGIAHLVSYPWTYLFVPVKSHTDHALLASPWVEVPELTQPHIEAKLRWIDPHLLHEDDFFGLGYKIEGGSTWTVLGLTGKDLAQVQQERIHFTEARVWQNEIHQFTQWHPIEFSLPEHAAGKRIQLGIWVRRHISAAMIGETPEQSFFLLDDLIMSANAPKRFAEPHWLPFHSSQLNPESLSMTVVNTALLP
jgi:hypothetical protein